jgi:iron complex outermembrane receptor protein
MPKPISLSLLVLLCTLPAAAQRDSSSRKTTKKPAIRPVRQTVVVVGSPEPVTLGESQRSVYVINTKQQPQTFQTAESYLRNDPSVFVEQRGAGGAQADISILGSSFEQTLVLVNGLRMNDSQTAHHDMDLPVPMAAMRSVEVLHGAGSTLYGSDAIGGVVDFLTAVPTKDSLTVSSGMGSFGENEESAMVTLAGHGWSELAAGERNFSTGFMPDRDYRNENASSETRWKSPLGTTDVLLAGSDRAFGANQFYGPYNSWERTKGWFGAVRQELGPKMEAVFGYRRHTDNFILLRNDPTFYANNHIDESYQAVLRRKDKLGKSMELFSGLEEDGDSIQSNNLGRHARNQGAGYLDLEIQPKGRWTASAGLREEILSGGGRSVLSPDVAANVRVSQKVRLRGSVGYGFRLPTYTDLYYSDPATIGNANLKPESAWSEDGGVDWFPNAKVEAELTAFYSRQHDTIDYVRANPQDKWHAANLTGLRFTGLEGLLTWQATRRQQVRLGWTGISGAQRALHGLQSEYVFNYPVNNASFAWRDHLRHAVLLQTRVLVAQRYKQTAYPVWDVEASRQKGRIRPYLRALNLSNTGYEEIQGVRMPGRSLTGGLEIQLGGS